MAKSKVRIFWGDALYYGLVLSAVFSAIVLLSYLADPLIWGNDFPLQVQEKIGTINDEVQQKAIIVFVLILSAMVISIMALNRKIIARDPSDGSFLNLAINGFVVLVLVNLVDLLVVDILIFNTLQPDFMMIEGAEDYMTEHTTAWFHTVAFFKVCPTYW